MAFTLPSYSKTIDNAFVRTWYEIRAQAIDNCLLATPVWALMKMKGCFVEQVGGSSIERTIKHTVGPTSIAVKKGTVLPSGEIETKTAAFFTWRYVSSHVQRNIFDDQQNSGKFRIVSYVEDRLTEARDSLVQKFETDLLRAQVTSDAGDEIRSLNDVLPPDSTSGAITGTYGGITRPATYSSTSGTTFVPATGNTFWGPKYFTGTAPSDVNLRQDMVHLFNSLDLNQGEPPDILLTTQEMLETYEENAADKAYIVKDVSTALADLGFQVLRFKGQPFTWSPNVTAKNVMMMNSKWIEVVYDPTLWFDMTPWKDSSAVDPTRLAHIICTMTGPITTQPRRHGRLAYA